MSAKPIISGWGANMFNGTATPALFWGARTIFHMRKHEQERNGFKRNRRGEIMREYKGGPPLWNYKETIIPAWLDYLPDRRGWGGSMYEAADNGANFDTLRQTPEFLHLVEWLDNKARPALEETIQSWEIMGQDVFELHEEVNGAKFHYRASPCASGGYVYIAAWRE